ncbi:BgtAc-30842 [Blumeria graminis f. sp. tritici]|uniref:BgtAc-30842 n=2 Tax=Blumeria graminis f. sp. tritici TaxID=62690 RepID=A0A9X9L7I1_BLUGR|nr:hypothetical protein BGT96224_Ac30842 [Blumeria graminis f. sp. tritici 96224]VCU38814.1 BgtAc-30842 [Blumeria graminis f. sp. tritici]
MSQSLLQSRHSSPHAAHAKPLLARRPRLIRAAATAPSLQTAIISQETHYSQSSTRAAVLLSQVATAGVSRQTRGTSIASLDSVSSHHDRVVAAKEPCSANSEYSLPAVTPASEGDGPAG